MTEHNVQSERTLAEERALKGSRRGRHAVRTEARPGLWHAFRRLSPWKRMAIAVPAALVTVAVLAVGVDVVAAAGRIHPGVRVGDVGVGGLSRAKAASRLETALSERMAEPVTVRFENRRWEVSPAEVSVSVEVTDAAESAFAIGREGRLVERIRVRAAAWFKPAVLRVPVAADQSAVESVLDTIAAVVDKAPGDASIEIDGTEVRLRPAVLGVAVRRAELEEEILSAFVSADREVVADVEFTPVTITDEDAQDALEATRKMLSAPATVVYEDASWEFTPVEIGEWIAYRAVSIEPTDSHAYAAPASGSAESEASPSEMPRSAHKRLEAYISAEEASATVTKRLGAVGRSAVDADFKVRGGVVSVIPSQDGIAPDVESLALELTRVLASDEERVVSLRTQRVEPEITTAEAQGMGIKERISTYTTTYDSSNKPRVNNIHTLADAIDGTLVAPGAVFSFNETVGPRTAAKGYQEAPAIVNGKLVPQLGGGICQFGTTIFNTVFESGFPVVERKNHSFYISHYPKGRDATLSWGGPDFKFKNDSANWVLIVTAYSASSVTVSLYGTDPGYDVKASAGPWTDVRAHIVREVPDSTMPVGSKIVEDTGVDGRSVVVTRTVLKDGSVVREDSFRSVYKPKEEVVRVGTKPVPDESVEATTTP